MGWFDRLRARFTARRPYQCWHCGWSGWVEMAPTDAAGSPDQLTEGVDAPKAAAGSSTKRKPPTNPSAA